MTSHYLARKSHVKDSYSALLTFNIDWILLKERLLNHFNSLITSFYPINNMTNTMIVLSSYFPIQSISYRQTCHSLS